MLPIQYQSMPVSTVVQDARRSTMLGSRLSNLSVLSMNQGMLNTIDYEAIIDIFSPKNRQYGFILSYFTMFSN